MVLPCPACGDVRYSAGPAGPPQRRCWACGHVWQPAPDQAAELRAAAADHPVVRAAIERLDGRIVRIRRSWRP